MGRPIKSAETVDGNVKLASVNTALPIGSSGIAGNQIIMKSQITGGTVRDTTEIKQKAINVSVAQMQMALKH